MRVFALAGLAAVALATLAELRDLHGELAFARFYRMRRMAEEARGAAALDPLVRSGVADGELVMLLARGNPDALWLVSRSYLGWAGRGDLGPLLRLNLADSAVQAAALCVCAAPSDYGNWMQLAHALAAVGLDEQARACLAQARRLAPPAMELAPDRPEERA